MIQTGASIRIRRLPRVVKDDVADVLLMTLLSDVADLDMDEVPTRLRMRPAA